LLELKSSRENSTLEYISLIFKYDVDNTSPFKIQRSVLQIGFFSGAQQLQYVKKNIGRVTIFLMQRWWQQH